MLSRKYWPFNWRVRRALRIKELLRQAGQVGRRDLELLRWGRHFRLSGGAKAVVGRTQRENEALAGLAAPGDLKLTVEDHPGPLVLVIGQALDRELQEAAGLAAAYSDAPLAAAVRVSVAGPGLVSVLHLDTPPKDRFKDLLI